MTNIDYSNMEFLQHKAIKAKLKKRSLLFKKLSLEDASSQFYTLARQLEDHKLYAGFCHLAVTKCQTRSRQVGALLNAARAFSQATYEVISIEDHIRAVIWIYTEALLVCDRSFIKSICLEMGQFYESHKMHQQAADCFKQSMSISRCVNNLILAKRYRSALDELKNYPSHLMTTKDHTSLFLLKLLLYDELSESNRNSMQYVPINDRTSTNRGSLSTDDHLFELNGLLQSLMIFQQDRKKMPHRKATYYNRVLQSITEKLSAYLDPAQLQLLHLIIASVTSKNKTPHV